MKTVLLLIGFIFASIHFAEAQQPVRIPRIGWLTAAPLSAMAFRTEAFRQGLRELGYVEGKNIVIEWRSPEGKPDLMPTLAAELVRLKVDIIVTAGEAVTRFVKKATSTIPIVMAQDSDPVGNGFVTTLAQPGGNITGLATLAPELSGKQLELLKEIVPKLSRVAVFATSTSADYARILKETEIAAGAFGGKIQHIDVRNPKDIETAFRAAVKDHADAVLMLIGGSVASPNRKKIVELAVTSRLPVMYERASYVEAGGLIFYGVNLNDLDRRTATYVDKILKGAKPADRSVEQPSKFELVINLKTAKQIGLAIPPNVLARADKVIK
jgi:putative tryptophan/tyrosine transport system substrate-binding protein